MLAGSAISSSSTILPRVIVKAKHDARPSARSPHGSRGAVHERRLCGAGTPREGPGDGGGAPDFLRRARRHGGVIGSKHDIRIERREQRVEVTAA